MENIATVKNGKMCHISSKPQKTGLEDGNSSFFAHNRIQGSNFHLDLYTTHTKHWKLSTKGYLLIIYYREKKILYK